MIDKPADAVVYGFVRDGVIVPNTPLPEDACVELRLTGQTMAEVWESHREEWEDWQQLSAGGTQCLLELEREDAIHAAG